MKITAIATHVCNGHMGNRVFAKVMKYRPGLWVRSEATRSFARVGSATD